MPAMSLTVTQNITLDGVIDASEGWFGPAGEEGVDTSDIEAVLREQMAREEAVLLGRTTFEEMRGFWPHQTDDTTGVSEHLDRVQKYVVSTTLDEPEWQHSTVLRGVDEVRELRAEAELQLTGSMTLVRTLIAERLVDAYRLFVYPVVLGRGVRLFEDATSVPELELTDCRPFRSGVALMSYRCR
jgi:dihydrofolate reductase